MTLPATDNFDGRENDPEGGNWTTPPGCSGFRTHAGYFTPSLVQTTAPWASYWNADSFDANHYSQAKGVNIDNYPSGPAVRIQTTGTKLNCYLIALRGSAVERFFEVNDGVFSQMGSDVTTAITTSSVCKLEANGSTLTFYKDGASQATRTDSTHAGGAAGFADNCGQSFDDWAGGNVSAAAASAPPWIHQPPPFHHMLIR